MVAYHDSGIADLVVVVVGVELGYHYYNNLDYDCHHLN